MQKGENHREQKLISALLGHRHPDCNDPCLCISVCAHAGFGSDCCRSSGCYTNGSAHAYPEFEGDYRRRPGCYTNSYAAPNLDASANPHAHSDQNAGPNPHPRTYLDTTTSLHTHPQGNGYPKSGGNTAGADFNFGDWLDTL